MTRQEIINACISTVEELRQAIFIPWDTGNMATNALQYKIEGDEFRVWIDEEIAPYVFFTNEPWTAARWHGKKNPNEGWWDEFAETLARRLALRLGGEITT